MTLRRIARGAWHDGWIAAWLAVTGVNLACAFLANGHLGPWFQGAFFGATLGISGGYLVTVNRNYRRTSRETLERELANMIDLEKRTIAWGQPPAVQKHVREAREQVQRALERLS